MDENKRRLWTGIAIRIFALLYLLYILYKLSALHSSGESGVTDTVFYLVCGGIALAELGIAATVFVGLKRYKKQKKDEE